MFGDGMAPVFLGGAIFFFFIGKKAGADQK